MHTKDEETHLHAHDDAVEESEDDIESLDFVQTRRPKTSRGCSKCVGWAFIFISIVFVSSLAGASLAAAYTRLDQNCAARTTQWSPILQDVKIEYSPQNFDGNFMQENIYRQQGSPEVDAAWEALGVDYRAGIISYDDGLASGLDPSFVQRADKYGGGFFVNVEGMHHLHCLNLVRKALYFNFDYYKKMKTHAFENGDDVLRLHVTHCLDTVRQVLMCNVDTGVLGQVWVGHDDPTAFPDFNTRHTCKNYNAVRNWAQKLQAASNDELPDDYLAHPEENVILPHTP